MLLGTYCNNYFLDVHFKLRLACIRSDKIPNEIFAELIFSYPITIFVNF